MLCVSSMASPIIGRMLPLIINDDMVTRTACTKLFRGYSMITISGLVPTQRTCCQKLSSAWYNVFRCTSFSRR